ncbi:MAG: hypothetical protein IH986_12300 [Planctomycetes bacterium]|nr:hypothetical protein [Planctomycetota bacterium]
MQRTIRTLRGLSTGAISLGLFQAFQDLDFASIFTNFLSTLFSLIVSLFLAPTSGLFA